MKQPNNIDHIFRQRLQQAAVPPPEHVWANVERSIQPRKRRFFLWLFAVGVSGMGVWALWQATYAAPLHTANQPINTSAKQPAIQAQPVTPASNDLNQKMTAATAAKELDAAAPHLLEKDDRLTTAKTVTAPVIKPRKIQASTPLKPKSTAIPPRQADALESQSKNDINPDIVERPENTRSTGQSTAITGLSSMTQLSSEGPFLLTIPARAPNIKPITIRPFKKKSPKKCYDFHTNREAWLLDAYAGPSFVHKSMYSANPEYKSYVQDRFASEKHQWAFNAGVRASYLFAGNFALRTGLHYEQFEERFEYIDPNFIKYTVVITQQFVNGQWQSVPDTVDIQYGANYVKTYNRFALLDIPLQAALELRSGVTGVSLNIGGSVNVLFRKRGNMLALDGKPVDLEQFQVFRPKLGLSLLGSIQWFYHLTPRTRVFAEPYYRYILDPVTKPTYPVEQSYGIGGIRFGVTQIFD